MGKLRLENKSDLLNNLYELCETQGSRSAINGVAINGSVPVKIYRTTGQRTFTAYFGKQWKQSLAVSVHYHLYKIKIFYELGEKNVVSI